MQVFMAQVRKLVVRSFIVKAMELVEGVDGVVEIGLIWRDAWRVMDGLGHA